MHKRNRERQGNLKLECGRCVHCIGVNIVVLNWQKTQWEGNQDVVRRSCRDEPML
jgi:hypothetical protein